jgi:uncharacterized membrane protein
MLYLIIKWLHVLADIAAFGASITYGLWLARSARTPQALVFTLQTIKHIEDRLATPAYAASLATGLALTIVGPWSFSASWLPLAFALYVATLLLGVFGFVPTLRRQIRLAETVGSQSPEYVNAARRAKMIGVVSATLVVVIVFLMVIKPRLWD